MDAIRGLIGRKLSHSFSKLVHERLADYSYDLIELEPEQLDSFMKRREFSAINVTIPYKQNVIPYLDYIDEVANKIGAVNTIVNKGGRLFGYNTDFMGLVYNIKMSGISLDEKTVLILGNGGTCKTACAVAEFLNAKAVFIASRTKSENTITYDDALKRTDIEVIINTTPIGMYPNGDSQPIEICGFGKLEGVVDVIYNPINTRLLLSAQALGIKCAGGLRMLVAQAKYSAEYFLGVPIDESRIEEIYSDIKLSKSNLVLIGMPGCGKSMLGQICADRLNRRFIDIDSIIEYRTQMKIAKIFELYGEERFRELEKITVNEFSQRTGLVISTGGGVIKFYDNIVNLKQNGVFAFIDRPANKLAVGNGRPLSDSLQAVLELHTIRYPLYLKACDFTVLNDSDIESAVLSLVESFMDSATQI